MSMLPPMSGMNGGPLSGNSPSIGVPFNPYGQSLQGGNTGLQGLISNLFGGFMPQGMNFGQQQFGMAGTGPEMYNGPQGPSSYQPGPNQPNATLLGSIFGNQPISTANGYTNPLPAPPARNLPGAIPGQQQGNPLASNPILSMLLGGLGSNLGSYLPQQGTPQSPSGPVTQAPNNMIGGALGSLLGMGSAKPGATTQPVARQTPADNGTGAAAPTQPGVRTLPPGLINLLNGRLGNGAANNLSFGNRFM